MGKRWGKTDFKQLQNLKQKMERLQKVDMDVFCSEESRKLAARLLRKVRKRSPVGSYEVISYTTKDGRGFRYNEGKEGGTLRNNWKVEPLERHGMKYEIEIINPTEYASYVEHGHRQTPGRFVPQIGKTLKSGWVEGNHMLKISEEEIQAIAPMYLERQLSKKLKEVFNDAK